MRHLVPTFSLLSCLFSTLAIQNGGDSGNWFGLGCPPHATGQFPYEADCKRFYNCYKGRGQLSVCAPGTLFNPETLECDFPSKVVCHKGSASGSQSSRFTEGQHDHNPNHQFHHSPDYHSQGHHSGSGSWSPDHQSSYHYQNWRHTHQPEYPHPDPPPRGHYIYQTKSVKAGSRRPPTYQSGVQPPSTYRSSPEHSLTSQSGLLIGVPARELLPPPAEDTAQSPVLVYPEPSYSPNYGPPAVVQSSISTQPQPNSAFDKKFGSVLPPPVITYNSLGQYEGREGFPEILPVASSDNFPKTTNSQPAFNRNPQQPFNTNQQQPINTNPRQSFNSNPLLPGRGEFPEILPVASSDAFPKINKNPQQPFNPNQQQSFYTSPQQPSNTNQQQPFNANPQQPFNANPQQPFNANPQQPFDTNQQQHFKTNPQQPFNTNQQQPLNTNPQQPFNTNHQQHFNTNPQQAFSSNHQQHFNPNPQQSSITNPQEPFNTNPQQVGREGFPQIPPVPSSDSFPNPDPKNTGFRRAQEPSVVPVIHPPGGYDVPIQRNGVPPYPYIPSGNTNALDDSDPSLAPKQENYRNRCPKDYSGLLPHSDCSKFLSCAHGRTFVMDCGPGTRFSPELMVCDYPHAVKCYSGEPNHEDVVVLVPEETQNPPDFFELPNRSGATPDQDAESITERETTLYLTTESVLRSSKNPEYDSVKKPRISIGKSKNTNPEPKPEESSVKNVFRPVNITLPKGKLISKRNSTLDRQILRLRGSPSQFEGFVEMQLAPGSWGIVCDKRNKWKSEEAHVVCKTLGFPRGAELTWQGLPAEVSNVTSDILAADEVMCTGEEESILDCTINVGSGCSPGADGVWVRCYGHGQSRCAGGELSLGDSCYSLVVPDEDAPSDQLVGFTQGEALKHCQTQGGRLLDITSQLENDFVSEWLVRQNIFGNIMTSGVGTLLMGVPVWIWEGGQLTFSYHNWWPGWKGVKSIAPQLTSGGAHCIVLRRHFPCLGSNATEEKLCDAQYYFWDVEDCTSMSTSQPYVCKRPANNIGCVTGTGHSYKGAANITKTGKHCVNWETKEVLGELKYKISEADRKMSLSGHNFCRNAAGKETHPWCYVKDGKTVKRELCDIPICSKAIEKSARYFQCPSNHYSCGVNGECILSTKVCDGRYDCSNANDEVGCGKPQNLQLAAEVTILSQFTLHLNMMLTVLEIEVLVDTPLEKCAKKCLERINCRSFSYMVSQKECLLSESNIGLSGSLVASQDWSYYELNAKSINCQLSHTCKNGKCIANETLCNGANDCGDNSDESDCMWLKQNIQIRLTGGSKPNEGAIEVKTTDRWGLVCDDEFDMKDGDVICRHLGYPHGALEIKKHGFFKPNHTSTFIIDNLNCTGNESSLADCHHNGWGIHDCGNEESMNSIDYVKCSNKAAGIICKDKKSECNFNYWQCESSSECIPLTFLCDNVRDCEDGSDEDPSRCRADVEVRLVGIGGISRSAKVMEGRVEVKRFGVWGTVCDDDFGEREASVVCKSLGYKGPAQAYKEAAFGAGSGIIWLDQVHCLGNETGIQQCLKDPWGQTNCRHNEDVAVTCSPEGLSPPPPKKVEEEEDEEEYDDDFLFMPDCGKPMDELHIDSSEFAPRVVSGFETVKGAYPWQASIRVKSVSGKSNHWCGAVVISRYHVLTAGHCLRDYIKAAYFVRAGDYDTEVVEGSEQDFEIDEIWIHPDIDKDVRLNNDIALVKVKSPGMQFGTWVIPACLPVNSGVDIPQNCTISGWGSNANPGTGFARTLHATWISPLPKNKCRSPSIYGDSLSDGMICAGSLEGGPDSCQGDSGGPLLCPQRGPLAVFGITSWGHGCGRSNSPGVYTSVPHYLDWIMAKIKESMRVRRPVNDRMLYDI